MDMIKLLKSINNLNEFMVATQVMVTDSSSLKVQLNLSTVLALKNIRSLEVEYFNKYYERGAALKMFELVLQVPPSKTWAVVGDELVCLIQYWLEAVRKHLITHNIYWWNFLSILLNFIQTIFTKHSLIINCLVEKTGDCLLDLATRSEPRPEQRYNIVQTFNKYCAFTNRQFRLATKHKFDKYLVLLSSIMAKCGDVRIQYSIMETLIRWLLPRHELKVREAATASWFPIHLYTPQTIKVFLERPWQYFFRDTRNFLNAHNETNDSVVSVICRKLAFGTIEVLSGPREYWLDLNCETKCLSIMLEPSLFKTLDISKQQLPMCDALVIKEENTTIVQLNREPRQIFISLKVVDPLQVFPSKILENSYDIHAAISSRSDFQLVDRALRTIFDQKYQVIVRNEDNAEAHQRYDSSQTLDYISEEDSRFSNPPAVLQQRQTAKQTDQRTSSTRQSPSSVSTSSLVTLRERLSAFPEYLFKKEVGRVSARPQLNSVSEVTETEEKQSHCSSPSTVKLGSYVCPSKNSNKEDKISQSESYCSQNSKYNENPDAENITDLLAQEALQYTCLEETRKFQNQKKEAANSIPNIYKSVKSRKCDRSFIKDSTDESRSAFVENTPAVNLDVKENTNILATRSSKQRIYNSISLKRKKNLFENDESILIRKINNTKSLGKINNSNINKSMKSPIHGPLTNVKNKIDFNYIEVEECLDAIVVKISEDFEKNFNQNKNKIINKVITNVGVKKVPFEKVTGPTEQSYKKTQNKVNSKPECNKIKLKFPNSKKHMETRRSKKNTKNSVKILPRIQKKGVENETINEDNVDLLQKISSDLGNTIKRKRKLYSPKDDDIVKAKVGIHVSETEEDNSVLSVYKTINTTPIFKSTSYKVLERNNSNRKYRSKLNFPSKIEDKNNVFDDLIKSVEGETNIKLVDTHLGKNATVYNFTSESEDDDFKQPAKIVSQITKTCTLTGKSIRPRIIKNVNLDSKYSSCPEINRKNIKRKNSKRQNGKNRLSRKRSREIVDERMRKAPNDVLNKSLIMEPEIVELSVEPEPIHKKPRMMSISGEQECEIFTIPDNKTKDQNGRNRNLRSRNKKNLINNKLVTLEKAEDREVSPLPGLVIETVPKISEPDDFVTVTMIEKFKDIYKSNHIPDISEGPHTKCNTKMSSCKLNKNENDESQSTSTGNDSNKSDNNQIVIVLDKLDLHAASLSTIGKSPITAHGISNEMPPAVEELDKEISRRSLDTQDLPKNVLNFYNILIKDVNESFNNGSSNNTADSQYDVCKDNNLDNVPRKSPERVKINLSPSVSITRLSPSLINKFLAPSKAVINTTQTSNNNVTKRQTRSNLRLNASPGNNTDKDEISITPRVQNVRVSTISPINLDRELNFEGNNFNHASFDRDSTTRKLDCLNAESPTYNLGSCSKSSLINKDPSAADSTVRICSKSMEILTEGSQTANIKRRNINQNINSSGQSGSSVQEWLLDNNRREKGHEDKNLDIFAKESLSNIREKLNTSLLEINHNTSRSLVKMVVNNQARLEQVLDELKSRYTQTVADIIRKLINNIGENFADTDKWARESVANVQSEIIEEARTILRYDARQKQYMIDLLDEDIQAGEDRIRRCADS